MGISRRGFIFGGFSTFSLSLAYPSYRFGERVNEHFSWDGKPQGNFDSIETREPKCSPLDNPVEITIGTWNLACIPLKDNWKFWRLSAARMKSAAEHIVEKDIDIIGLQEMFDPWSRDDLLESLGKLGSDLAYNTYYPSEWGSGLLTLSRYPLESADFLQFSVQGDPLRFWQGEYFAGKGVSHNNVRINDSMCLDFCNTHIHAKYYSTRLNRYADDVDKAKRVNQRKELVDHNEERSIGKGLMFLAGDLNCATYTHELRGFEEYSGYERVVEVGIRPRAKYGKDHIYARSDMYSIELLGTRLLPERVAGITISDHFGYASKIRIT